MIRLEAVSMTLGGREVLHDLSFEATSSGVVGFLGPNGAGKTTTMRLIAGYWQPDRGRVQTAGFDCRTHGAAARARLGYLPENNPLYDGMLVGEYLHAAGKLRGLAGQRLRRAMGEAVTVCGLETVFQRSIRNLSKGFRQRVGLAQTLLHDPPLLLLDEPTAGLDPNQIENLLTAIRQLGTRKTVLVSTHILHHVPVLCDRVLLIHEGSLAFDGAPAELVSRGGRPRAAEVWADSGPEEAERLFASLPFISDWQAGETENGFNVYRLSGEFDREAMARLNGAMVAAAWRVAGLGTHGDDLERVFAHLTGGRP